eukprot:scaffold46805_cov176-Amphora_coffeaeformis.AAC.1
MSCITTHAPASHHYPINHNNQRYTLSRNKQQQQASSIKQPWKKRHSLRVIIFAILAVLDEISARQMNPFSITCDHATAWISFPPKRLPFLNVTTTTNIADW